MHQAHALLRAAGRARLEARPKPSHLDYFWLNSDWAYLGADRLEALARTTPAHTTKPVDLPDVYARTGGVLLSQRSREQQDYHVARLRRWCRKASPSTRTPPYVPERRPGLAPRDRGGPAGGGAVRPSFTRVVEDRDISSDPTLREIVAAQGLDADALLRAAAAPDRAALPPVHRRSGRRRRVRLAVVCLCRRAVLGPGPAGMLEEAR